MSAGISDVSLDGAVEGLTRRYTPSPFPRIGYAEGRLEKGISRKDEDLWVFVAVGPLLLRKLRPRSAVVLGR